MTFALHLNPSMKNPSSIHANKINHKNNNNNNNNKNNNNKNNNHHYGLGVMAFSTPLPPRHSIPSLSSSSSSSSPDPIGKSPSLIQTNQETTTMTSPYDNPSFLQAYKDAMEQVLSSFRILQKNNQPSDLEVAKRYLFSPQRLPMGDILLIDTVSSSSSSSSSSSTCMEKEEFQKSKSIQKEHFLKTSGMEPHHLVLVMRALSYLGDYCAKKRISEPLHVAWDKIKESGSRPRENTLSTYLYAFSSFPLNVYDDNDNDHDYRTTAAVELVVGEDGYDPRDVSREVAFYHDMMYKPTENTVSIRIKSLVEQACAQEAEELLWSLESEVMVEEDDGGGGGGVGQSGMQKSSPPKKSDASSTRESHLLRLRTCLPVLKSYCHPEGDMSRGLRLFQKMMRAPSVHLEAETYVLVLSALARRGYFRHDSEPIEDFVDLGYLEGKGASLFDAIVTEMAQDVLEITSASAKDIRNAMVVGFASLSCCVRTLQEVPYDCDLAPLNEAAAEDELVANRVRIGTNSTVCPRTNATLRLILLDDVQRQHMHDALLRMADSQFDAYETKLQTKGNKPSKLSLEENYAGKHLEGFAEWLNEREGEPFTAIIDGANVAYYGLGCINYHQLKLMVSALEKMGENPLVIIPQKYTQKKFYLRQGYIQELPDEQLEIIQDLESSGKLYVVPHRCLDDYYWMLSSVSPQTKSRNGAVLDVPADNDQGRFPGTRPILISNDQMRDHKLELLEPKLFRRWVSSHIVNYHFTPFFNDLKEERDIAFSPADFTSREIQGNPCGFNSVESGDGAIAWHFPVSDWDKNDRFCVKIPRTKI